MIFNRLVIICAVYWNCFRLLSASDTQAAAAFWNKARACGVARQHHSTLHEDCPPWDAYFLEGHARLRSSVSR